MSGGEENFFSEHRPVARRDYVCAQCRRGIARGERYVRVSWRDFGGRFGRHVAHVECYEFATVQVCPGGVNFGGGGSGDGAGRVVKRPAEAVAAVPSGSNFSQVSA